MTTAQTDVRSTNKETGRGACERLSDLTARNVETIAKLEQGEHALRGVADQFADLITRFAGSMNFVYIHLLWFGAWVIANSLPIVPASWRVDPFPFTFLTFVVSLEAIFLSTFILISQNHEQRLAERRNHLDLQINLLSEQENSKMLAMLESIQQRLGIEDVDPELQTLEEATEPEKLVEQIDNVVEHCRKTPAGS